MTTYGEWLDKLAELIGRRYVSGRSFILQSYFRRGFTPELAAELYNPDTFITEETPR